MPWTVRVQSQSPRIGIIPREPLRALTIVYPNWLVSFSVLIFVLIREGGDQNPVTTGNCSLNLTMRVNGLLRRFFLFYLVWWLHLKKKESIIRHTLNPYKPEIRKLPSDIKRFLAICYIWSDLWSVWLGKKVAAFFLHYQSGVFISIEY